MAELMGTIAYELSLIQPLVPMYLHLLVAALFPIYTGSHASLFRPSSAAKPPKHKKETEDTDEDDVADDRGQSMEGLSPSDALMFPLLAGTTLAGLYFLIKWLEDPALLNMILNWYFSVFGVLSVARLLTDILGVLTSFIFPAKYADKGIIWHVDNRRRMAVKKAESEDPQPDARCSPLPGVLGRIRLPKLALNTLWTLRIVPSRRLRVRAYAPSIIEADLRIGIQGFFSFALGLMIVIYFNLIAKPWWLTNLLGFGFSYSALQFMSPTTFWTGTMILSSLFLYDIYFVFFTPLMVTVATKLDIPIKLLFPRPPGPNADPTKQSLSMLGLGDIVLPGIMIGLALRFDLYLFYLRKQTKRAASGVDTSEMTKAHWNPATGRWGERFWNSWPLTSTDRSQHREGGRFPKTYFHASLVGYVIGMLCTLAVMQVAGHAQPALLYLVPGVLGSLWGTALVRGELKEMWHYTEQTEEENGQGKQQNKGLESIFSLARAEKTAKKLEQSLVKSKSVATEEERDPETSKTPHENLNSSKESPSWDKTRDVIFFSISLPPVPSSADTSAEPRPATKPASRSLEEELRLASEGNLDSDSATDSSFASSNSSSPLRRPTARQTEEPVGKRQRLE